MNEGIKYKLVGVTQINTGKKYTFKYSENDLKFNQLLLINKGKKRIAVLVNNVYQPEDSQDYEELDIVKKFARYNKALGPDNCKEFDMSDPRIVGKLTEFNIDNFQYANEDLKNDPEFVRKLLNRKEIKYQSTDWFALLAYMGDKLKNNKSFASQCIDTKGYGYVLKYFSDDIRNDEKIIMKAVSKEYYRKVELYPYIGNKLKSDKSFLEKLLLKKIYYITFIPNDLKDDVDFARKIISANGHFLKYFNKSIRSNPEMIELARNNIENKWVDLDIPFEYCEYVTMRDSRSRSKFYPERFGHYAYNKVIIKKEIADSLLVKGPNAKTRVLNFASLIKYTYANMCSANSSHWVTEENENTVCVKFKCYLEDDSFSLFISKLIETYKNDIDWYYQQYSVQSHYSVVDEDLYATFPNPIITHLFYEDGYVADEYLCGDMFVDENDLWA